MTSFEASVHPWNQDIWASLTRDNQRQNHALLLHGHRGLGKITTAFALTRKVVCAEHAQSAELFAGGSHPDVHIVLPEDQLTAESENPASSTAEELMSDFARRYLEQHSGKPKKAITIEQIRRLSQAMTTHPHISQMRVVMIGYAERMNRNAANALLKNLEEPPANTMFVLVTDEVSMLPKTIRSRCSLVDFRAPDASTGQQWLATQGDFADHEISNHLAMANNQPLLALSMLKDGYVDTLKTIFNDVNGLWNRQRDPVAVAKTWQTIGGKQSIDILQKLTADLLRCCLAEDPREVFFPVQQTWINSASAKLDKRRLLNTIDELVYARKMLNTTVDELLVLESVSAHVRALPA